MANQNLSEFGEKLFVADADHTFIWDTAASISKRVSRNSWLNSGTLTSDAPVTISQTWAGTGSTVFKALVVNATTPGTTSSSSSLLLDLQVGGVTQASANKSGQISAASFVFAADSGAGLFRSGNNRLDLRLGSTVLAFAGGQANGLYVKNQIGFDSSGDTAGAFNYVQDTILLRDGAANTLALRNGAAAQTFRVYNTYTDASNYERVRMNWVSDTFAIFAEAAGTGTQRNINIGGTITALWSGSSLTRRWNVNASGHFTAEADNSYDIGASGASRPRDIHAGGNGIFGGLISALNGFRAPSSSQLIASANGIWRLTNSNADDFNRLQFGGTTNLFPAIKRSSTTLQARLADDSAFAPIQGKLTTDTAFDATVVTPTGFITLYDSTGTAYKVPCVPA